MSYNVIITDVNECEGIPLPCSDRCENLPGTYRCHCNDTTRFPTADGNCTGCNGFNSFVLVDKLRYIMPQISMSVLDDHNNVTKHVII